MGFYQQLRRAWDVSGSMLCVGLDPDSERLPVRFRGGSDDILRFCIEIVDATADLVCAFKPQIAHFASHRAEASLEKVCDYIRDHYPDVTLILDAKRGDIGSTAEHYAREAFERYGAHAVTVNPYLGGDSLTPYFDHGGGILVVCRTSNPGGADLQMLDVGGLPLYMRVAETVAKDWARFGDCGVVVGANYPDELRAVRSIASDLPFLVPGAGVQGGNPRLAVEAGADQDGRGLILSASRSVLYASQDDDFANAARAAAIEIRDAVQTSPNGNPIQSTLAESDTSI